jgi:predicted MFS family arabinose efflux permease
VLARLLMGFPLGVFLGYTITVAISLIEGGGAYLPVAPQLTREMGSEMNAVLLQYLLAGLLGASTAAGSAVWEMENWSVTRMTATHFLVLSLSMLPIAWFSHWMEHTVTAFLGYFAIFVGIYVVIWLAMYLPLKRSVARVAQRMKTER